MLWYKAWLETRWRFVTGAALLTLSGIGTVFAYPQVMRILESAPTITAAGEVGRRVREGVELARTYRGYVWSQSFSQNLPQLITLFAALLGSGGVLSRGSGATLFTLSLPISRGLVLGVRALTGLGELAVIATAPAAAMLVFSPAVGQSYGLADAVVHSLCLFVAGSVFYALALLMSTTFDDIWRPLLASCIVAVAIGIATLVLADLRPFSVFTVMSGETWFRGRQFPWLGLVSSAAVSSALYYFASVNIARRDF